jgi:hypothetical protein
MLFRMILVIALAALGGVPAVSEAKPIEQGCHRYVVIETRVFSGQHWTYTVRVQGIHATSITCSEGGKLINQFDDFIGRKAEDGGWNVGQYYRVGHWLCESFRPYAGGPAGHFLTNENCKQSGGGKLTWQEEQLSAKKTS